MITLHFKLFEMKINNNSKLIRNNEILASEMDGETVMMSIENSEYYSLSKIGTVIWGILETEITFSKLIDILTEKYNVERNICENDTLEFLENSIKKNVILINDK